MRDTKHAAVWFAAGAIASVVTFYALQSGENDASEGDAPSQHNVAAASGGVEFESNLGPYEFRVDERTVKSRYNGPILYKTHVAYSPYFAGQYGFPNEFVDKGMPSYVDYFAMDIKYAGEFSSCHIKLLIDKDGPIPLPTEDIFEAHSGGNLNMLRSALPKRNTGVREKDYQWEYRMKKSELDSHPGLGDTILNSFTLTGFEDEQNPKRESTSFTVQIEKLKNRLFSEWVYVELGTRCGSLTKKAFSHKSVYVLGNPLEKKRNFLPGPRTFDKSVKIPIPSAVKRAVEHDLSRMNFD